MFDWFWPRFLRVKVPVIQDFQPIFLAICTPALLLPPSSHVLVMTGRFHGIFYSTLLQGIYELISMILYEKKPNFEVTIEASWEQTGPRHTFRSWPYLLRVCHTYNRHRYQTYKWVLFKEIEFVIFTYFFLILHFLLFTFCLQFEDVKHTLIKIKSRLVTFT